MNEHEIFDQVNSLVEQEHRLRTALSQRKIEAGTEQSELKAIERSLDQCWDLLRQRRARLASGQDPDTAEVRPSAEVEGYRQ